MFTPAESAPAAATVPAFARPPTGLWSRLHQAWCRCLLSPEDAWLQGAADLADLERRLQRLERGRPDRFGPLPPSPP